jgi:hypothetical protein
MTNLIGLKESILIETPSKLKGPTTSFNFEEVRDSSVVVANRLSQSVSIEPLNLFV